MKYYYAFLIIGLIIVSGCVSQQSSNSNNGIVINEFSVDPKTAEYGDTVRLFLDGENVGGTTAECVTTELFGLEGGWTNLDGTLFKPVFSNQNFGITVDLSKGFQGISIFYKNLEKNININAGYTKGAGASVSVGVGGVFTDFASQYCNSLNNNNMEIKFEPVLSPPLAERNKPGQSFTADWILKPPQVPEGLKVDYPVTARTSFFYTSNAQVNIQAFSKAEYKRRQDIGDTITYPLNVVNTHAAPIQVQIERGASPIVVSTDTSTGDADTFNYLIDITNVGNGYPLPFSSIQSTQGLGPDYESGFVIATMTIAGPGAQFTDCLGQSGNEVVIGPDAVQNLVKLRSDGKAPFGCKISIDKNVWQTNPVGTISITFNIFYRYYIDKQVTVTVVGPSRS